MNTENELNQEEILRIIRNMILAAKEDVRDDSFTYLLWGWLVFIASISQFVLLKLESEYNGLPWLLMPLGGLITAIYWTRKGKKMRTKTAASQALKYLWISFGTALFIVLFFNHMSILQVLPTIVVLYGIGLFGSGGILEFKPLIYGGIFCWLCAIAGYEVQNSYQLLVLASAVLGGYIVPGYLLKMNQQK